MLIYAVDPHIFERGDSTKRTISPTGQGEEKTNAYGKLAIYVELLAFFVICNPFLTEQIFVVNYKTDASFDYILRAY